MTGIFPVKGQPIGFRGLRIEKDAKIDNFRVTNRHQLPAILSTSQPPGHWPGVGGGIAYDLVTRRPYYSDGFIWLPMGSGAPGTVGSYSFIKDGVQLIPRVVNTTITLWEISSSDVYHTLLGWNLLTGIYTALVDEVLTLEVNISWSAGVSNLGDRTLRIQHMKFGVPGWVTIKQVRTQADPDIRVQSTQECQIHAKISQGDSIRVTVEHNASISVSIASGLCTSISGFRVNVI